MADNNKNNKVLVAIAILELIIILLIVGVMYYIVKSNNCSCFNSNLLSMQNTQSNNTIIRNDRQNVINETNDVSGTSNAQANNNTTEEISTKTQEKEYSFSNDFGDGNKTITIKASKCLQLGGFAGASNNVYYLKDGNLYFMTLVNFETKLLATNISDISLKEVVIATTTEKTMKIEDNQYVQYK